MNYLSIVSGERQLILKGMRLRLEAACLGESLENMPGHVNPISAIPTLILTLPFEHVDPDHRAGFSVLVSQTSFKPISASWYRANGQDTYRESCLTDEEFEIFTNYYQKHFKDLWSGFCKCVID